MDCEGVGEIVPLVDRLTLIDLFFKKLKRVTSKNRLTYSHLEALQVQTLDRRELSPPLENFPHGAFPPEWLEGP